MIEFDSPEKVMATRSIRSSRLSIGLSGQTSKWEVCMDAASSDIWAEGLQ